MFEAFSNNLTERLSRARAMRRLLYRVYQNKVYSWKIFPKIMSAQNSRKLSVSLGSLAPSGTSSTQFI